MEQAKNAGRFRKGQSGNPKGRPRRDAGAFERRDGWINSASGHGTARDRRLLTTFGIDVVTDLEALQLWRSEFLAARIIEAIPSEAFRRGYTIMIDGSAGKKQAEAVAARAEELGVDAALTKAGQYERAYGGAAIFPVLSGAVGDLATELDEDHIASVDALHLLEPRELQPATWYSDIESPKFNTPRTYRLFPLAAGRGGSLPYVEIHESRLIIFPGVRVSHQTQPGQRPGWGDSALCRPRQTIADFGIAWGSAATLLADFAQGVLKLDGLTEVLGQSDGDQVVAKRLAAMDMARSTLRSMVIDMKDDFLRSTTPLSGLDAVLVQFAQLMAAAADMPVTVMLGMSPAGLNATGEFDIRGWYDRIARVQAQVYRPRLERLLRLIMRASSGPTKGKEPEVWSIDFHPLWEPTEKERAETRKVIAETDKIYFDIGAASPEDIATSRWKGDSFSAEMVIDWKAREEQAKLDEQRAADLDAAALAAMGRGPQLVEEEPSDDPLVPPEAS